MLLSSFVVVFFFKQKTAYDMRISDWSSDVCSSDLFIKELAYSILTDDQQEHLQQHLEIDLATEAGGLGRFRVNVFHQRGALGMVMRYVRAQELDRASCRESVCQSV